MAGRSRIDQATVYELAKLHRIQANIEAAVAAGRISARDGRERCARAEQFTANRLAFIQGRPRPKQRVPRPLDDPDAGRVA